jgi:beta-D-xylosidase 4
LKSNKICDVKASPSERAAALVAAMQTQEKLDNLMRYDMSLENEES